MNKRQIFRKSVAWLLITAMVNPAVMAPAYARDSDIYQLVSGLVASAEPNVLIILGTNDRMNAAEAWREYPPTVDPLNPTNPLNYDSHAEYLWNDINVISAAEVVAENAAKISDAAPPVNPFSPWGTWSGTTSLERKQLWQATLAYAQGTQPGDPGARTTFRNYNDLSWYHWLPTGIATTDPRLWSVSFNRFRGYQQVLGGVARGGVTFTAANNFTTFNQCASSLTTLQPSTIFMPSNAAGNSGMYLNQQWARFEPYLSLATTNNGGYPGVQTNTGGRAQGYLDSSVNPPNTPYRDQANSSGFTGDRGQPIRTQQAGSNSNWANVAADGGGYVYQSLVLNSATAALTALRTTAYGGTYNLLTSTGATAAQNEQFSAWKGSRDPAPAPAFGMQTGTPGYYDVTQPVYPAVTPICDPVTGITPPGTGGTSATCINVPAGGGTVTKTRPCNYVAPVLVPAVPNPENDASLTGRYRPTGSCASGVINCVNTNTAALPNPPYCSGGTGAGLLPADPGACALLPAQQNTFITARSTCAWSGRLSVPVATCTWAGRTSVYIEGQGTYFYGGTCGENGVVSTAPGSSCSIGGGTLVASRVLNGVAQPNVTGPFSSPPPANGATTLNCNNLISAGTWYYGGTCQGTRRTKNAGIGSADTISAVSTANCNISGTGSQSIRNTPYTNTVFNNAATGCNANADTVGTCTGRYGAQCDNNAPFCSPVTSQASVGAGNRFYQVYNLQATTTNFVHDCKADEPAGNAPNGYMYNNPTRVFNNVWGSAVSIGAGTPARSYTDAPGLAVSADPTKNIDVYSVNYLNWLYGAKACRDSLGTLITAGPIGAPPAGATCVPIARKTRLQVAKDALTGLVQATDGVRIGLMVYNKTDTGLSDDGGNIPYAIHRMGSNALDPDFANRANLVAKIQGVVASSRTPLTETMYEAYRYFAGRTPKWGTSAALTFGGVIACGSNTVSACYDASVGANANATGPGLPATVNLLASAGGVYNSPMLNNPDVGPKDAPDPARPPQLLKGPAACQKNYIVMITNGQPEEDAAANADIKTMQWVDPSTIAPAPAPPPTTWSPNTSLNSNGPAGSAFNQIPTTSGNPPFGPTDLAGTGSDGGYVWLDELTYFMANADVSPGEPNLPGDAATADAFWGGTDRLPGRQSIVTYTIGFAGVSAPVVQNAAEAATGTYYVAQNAQQLQAALQAAFIAITNWNPTAAAATVPISSLNRGESSTDIYLAFFGPNPASTWTGTVKKYQLGTDELLCGTGISLCLIGQTLIAANGNYNIESTDPVSQQAIVDPTAVSGPNCDVVPPATTCKPPGTNSAWQPITVQDGSLPSSGGTGYDLRSTVGYTPANRRVYTFLTGVSGNTNLTAAINSVSVGNAAITPAMVNAVPASQRDTLINFIRGADAADPTLWATWPHFDVQHSRPTIVTYDSSVNPPVQYLFYVQNNGMLTAIDAHTGQEKWSFLIEEALPQLSALYANVNGPEQYVADGSPAVFLDDHFNAAVPANTNGDGIVNGTDRVWLYFGLRRGGRVYYALDITDINAPVFKWKITANGGSGQKCLNAAGCSASSLYDELGQSWATPAIGRIRKFPALLDPPAVIFGGGYDTAEDSIPPTARSMGRALYVVNGDDGSVIQSWGVGQINPGYKGGGGQITTYAIPSDVTAVNADNDAQGFLDRIYVGDMGGNVWRFDIDNFNETLWRGEQLASLSNALGEKRKFFFAPAVAPQVAHVGLASLKFDAVYIGSGDKEHPLQTQTTVPAVSDDKIFMLMDDPTLVSGGGTPTVALPSGNSTPITPGNLLTILDTDTTGAVPEANLGNPGVQGWMRALDTGEKVTNSPTVFFNHLRFGTYAPAGTVNLCTPGGAGRLNDINALTGDLFTLNSSQAMSPTQRYYSSFLTRGYVSSGQLLVIGKNIYHIVVSDARLQSLLVGTIGAATKIYWYMEPEQ